MNREAIRAVFLAAGFPIKDGQADLKAYVYDAAEALLAANRPEHVNLYLRNLRIERATLAHGLRLAENKVLHLEAALAQARTDLAAKTSQVQALLDHCPDAECYRCAAILCPHGEELHFHHDGCPACAEMGSAHD